VLQPEAILPRMRRCFVDRRYSPSTGMGLSEWELIFDELIRMGYIVKKNLIVITVNESFVVCRDVVSSCSFAFVRFCCDIAFVRFRCDIDFVRFHCDITFVRFCCDIAFM
jgi:hypothetical protein